MKDSIKLINQQPKYEKYTKYWYFDIITMLNF